MSEKQITYRSDIAGLRGVAVMLVVIYHYFPGVLKGGFAGVDIFFVISGYLISKIVIEDLAANKFSFVNFYTRRTKRILPSLIVVLVASMAIGWFVFLPADYMQLGKHVAGAAVFVSNFVLWSEAGYFDVASSYKPLLHLWSLGIEEQFYLGWPLLLWLGHRYGLSPLIVSLVVGGVSFAINVQTVSSNEISAFYLPQSRLWELLMGAVVACNDLRPQLQAKSPQFLNALSALGVVLLGISVCTLSEFNQFPGWAAVLPTVGASLVISAGNGAWFNRSIISSHTLQWFGAISYPLYLWHWLTLATIRILADRILNLEIRILAVVASVFLAWLTYQIIERPFRHDGKSNIKCRFLLVALLITGGAGISCYYLAGIESRQSIQALHQSITKMAWPRINNSSGGCKQKYPGHFYCVLEGQESPTIALLGDSHANHFYPGLAIEYSFRGERLINLGDPGCPPILDVESSFEGSANQCHDGNREMFRQILSQPEIHTVILAANWHHYLLGTRYKESPSQKKLALRSKVMPTVDENVAVFNIQMRATIALLQQAGKTIVVIKQIPELDCVGAMRPSKNPFAVAIQPSECRLPVSAVREYLSEYEKYFDAFFDGTKEIKIVDPTSYFCDENYCYGRNVDEPLYRDNGHLSESGSRFFAAALLNRPK